MFYSIEGADVGEVQHKPDSNRILDIVDFIDAEIPITVIPTVCVHFRDSVFRD